MSIADWQILIVEDENDSHEVVQTILAYHNIQSIHAATAEDALVMLADTTPTLIIIDLALPGMDGWQLLAALNTMAHLANVPRVAITAYHHLELADQALAAGFDAYFAKPIEAASFVHDLAAVIENK
ncbi:MAG: response regulator [Anaerolineae bacterium]|nr:response regulator [Anaerolineae bacterium]